MTSRLSSTIANIVTSYLGKYLELSGKDISLGKDISVNDVKLKEAAFADTKLPIKVKHGKVSKLVISIPWSIDLFNRPWKVEIDGLHLLVVPSSSEKYNEEQELREMQVRIKACECQVNESASSICY